MPILSSTQLLLSQTFSALRDLSGRLGVGNQMTCGENSLKHKREPAKLSSYREAARYSAHAAFFRMHACDSILQSCLYH